MKFEQAVEFTLRQEGGYSNNPMDSGGPTKYGITLKTLSEHRGKTCSEEDVKFMSIQEARDIYKSRYWDPCHCEFLPPQVAACVFDAAVNSGVTRSSKWLQAAVGTFQDGVIGHRTIMACKDKNVNDVVNDLLNARLDFLTRLKAWDYFGSGWSNRIYALREFVQSDKTS